MKKVSINVSTYQIIAGARRKIIAVARRKIIAVARRQIIAIIAVSRMNYE